MQQGEFSQILFPESQVPAITRTSPTRSGRQLLRTATLFTDRNGCHTTNHMSIPLDTTGFT